jgi:heme-degrading monooxygenase HmoA
MDQWPHRSARQRFLGRALAVTEAIWRDILDFDGYVSHELLVDADDPGHLFVVSQWASRNHADEAL